MVYDIDMLRNFYANFPRRVDTARERIGGRPMTLAEKILYAHLRFSRPRSSGDHRYVRGLCPLFWGNSHRNF